MWRRSWWRSPMCIFSLACKDQWSRSEVRGAVHLNINSFEPSNRVAISACGASTRSFWSLFWLCSITKLLVRGANGGGFVFVRQLQPREMTNDVERRGRSQRRSNVDVMSERMRRSLRRQVQDNWRQCSSEQNRLHHKVLSPNGCRWCYCGNTDQTMCVLFACSCAVSRVCFTIISKSLKKFAIRHRAAGQHISRRYSNSLTILRTPPCRYHPLSLPLSQTFLLVFAYPSLHLFTSHTFRIHKD